MDEQEYLEPDFDPSILTVPRLRSILVAHNVNYPSSAKKGQLVDLFNEHVVPQARKLRAANARVKRTSRGIVDVPAGQMNVGDDDEEDEVEVAQPSTARRGRRTTARARTEEAQEVVPTPRSARHSTAPPESLPRRTPSAKHSRTLERVEQEPDSTRPASRKSRLSSQTPVAAKVELADDDSPFSADNVFQSGISPPPSTSDRRRTTSSARQDLERRRSREARRRTEEVKPIRAQLDASAVPTRRTFEVPVSVLKKPKREQIEPTEEFTPEAQMELERAEQAGELALTHSRPRRPPSTVAKTGVGAVLTSILLGVAALWGQEKFNVGYCGEGHASREIAGVEIPEWADVLRPQCEPCPPHAMCGPNFQTTCEPDFVYTPHPLSLNGLLPLPPTCEPDSVKAKKVEKVKERAITELREHNAKFECGEPVQPEIRESELKKRVSSKRLSRMADREFEELWASAIGEIRDADEVSTGTDGSGHFTLRSSSLARLPLSCAIRRSIRQTAREYLWQLITALLILSSGTYARYRITSSRDTENRAKRLAGLALDKLSQQASLHAAEPQTYREGWISMAQLRDDVLRNEWSTWNKKKLWDKVQQKVEKNANVRPMVREGRTGDVGRVWEWVGAVGMLESPSEAEPNRRKSGRVSFGGERWIEPSSFADSTEMSEVGKSSRWEEGRQYF